MGESTKAARQQRFTEFLEWATGEDSPFGQALNQERVAALLDMSPEHLSNVKHGRTGVSKRLARNIESAFRWRAEWLLTGEGPRKHPAMSPLVTADMLRQHQQLIAGGQYEPAPVIDDPTAIDWRALRSTSVPSAVGGHLREQVMVIPNAFAGFAPDERLLLYWEDPTWEAGQRGRHWYVVLDVDRHDPAELVGHLVCCSVPHEPGWAIGEVRGSADDPFFVPEGESNLACSLREGEEHPIFGSVFLLIEDPVEAPHFQPRINAMTGE